MSIVYGPTFGSNLRKHLSKWSKVFKASCLGKLAFLRQAALQELQVGGLRCALLGQQDVGTTTSLLDLTPNHKVLSIVFFWGFQTGSTIWQKNGMCSIAFTLSKQKLLDCRCLPSIQKTSKHLSFSYLFSTKTTCLSGGRLSASFSQFCRKNRSLLMTIWRPWKAKKALAWSSLAKARMFLIFDKLILRRQRGKPAFHGAKNLWKNSCQKQWDKNRQVIYVFVYPPNSWPAKGNSTLLMRICIFYTYLDILSASRKKSPEVSGKTCTVRGNMFWNIHQLHVAFFIQWSI